MTKDILIYALRKGETRAFMEELISTKCQNEQHVEKVKKAAAAEGYHSFRVTTYDGQAPNFLSSITV